MKEYRALTADGMQVRVAVLAEAQVKLQLTLKAYVLSKDHINSLEQWQPTQHVSAESLDGAEVQQVITCTQPGFGNADDPADLLGGTSDFVFSGQSSSLSTVCRLCSPAES